MRKWITILMTLTLLGVGRPAWADSAPLIAAGPNLQPMNSTTVRMESEQIEISLRRAPSRTREEFSFQAVGDYRIRFHFIPTADETMQAGFPLWVIDPQSGLWGAHITDFKAAVGGQTLPSETRFIPWDHGQQDWAVFALTFRKGEPLDLDVSYSLEVSPFGKGQDSDLWISYILQTGALWAGTIGHAEATLKLDRPIRQEDIRLPGRTTPGWTLVDGALHWEWRDLEPDFNLSVQMANVYWLDAPDDLRALIAAGVKNRDDLMRIWYGTSALFEGDRSGLWMQVRGGSAEQVGEAFLPDVLKLLADYIQQNPQDTEMQDHYLRLLYDSSLHMVADGTYVTYYSLYNDGRFRTWLAESRKYRQATGSDAYGLDWFPWVAGHRTVAHLSDAGQAETAAVLLELMPASFPSEGGARLWAQQAAGQSPPVLTGAHAQSLLDAALQRVAPEPEPPATPIGPATIAEPAPQAQAPEAPAPAPAARGWPVWAGAGILLAAAGGLLWIRRGRTSSANGGR